MKHRDDMDSGPEAPFIAALRDDLPSPRSEERLRARLIAAGVLAGTATVSSGAAASGVSALGGAGASGAVASGAGPAASAGASAGAAGGALAGAGITTGALGAAPAATQVGIWAKLVALPVAAKVGVATVAVGVAASGVPALVPLVEPEAHRVAVSVPAPSSNVAPGTGERPRAGRGAAPASSAAALAPGEASATAAVSSVQSAPHREPGAGADAPQVGDGPEPRVVDSAPSIRAPRVPQSSGTAAVPAVVPELPGRLTVAARHEAATLETPASRAGAQRSSAAAALAPVAAAPDRAQRVGAPAAIANTVSDPQPSQTTPVAGGAIAPAPPTSTLARETELMEHAIAALARGDGPRALGWLREHERRFPAGVLAPERRRAIQRAERLAP